MPRRKRSPDCTGDRDTCKCHGCKRSRAYLKRLHEDVAKRCAALDRAEMITGNDLAIVINAKPFF